MSIIVIQKGILRLIIKLSVERGKSNLGEVVVVQLTVVKVSG